MVRDKLDQALDNFGKYLNNRSMGSRSPRIIEFSKLKNAELDSIGKKAFQIAELVRLDLPIPDGFVITTAFFQKFLVETGIDLKIKEVQKISHPAIKDSIHKLFIPIQKDIMHASMPEDLKTEIYRAYKRLCGIFKEPSLNIFSSSPGNNKFIKFLNVKGDANLVLKIKEIWGGNIEHPVAIIVQKNIVSKTKGTIITTSPPKELEQIAKKIQKHFYFPQVVDYAIEKNKIYIIQIKPFTGVIEYESTKNQPSIFRSKKTLIKGLPINPGIVTGPVKIFRKNYKFKIQNGDIIVTHELNSGTYLAIKNARALIIDSVLPKTIDKILYRKSVKIPTIEGAENASRLLQNGHIVTVNGMSGEIYSGGLVY